MSVQYSYFGSRRLSPGGLSPMSETRGPPVAPRRIFVGGLHRSGTSILASLLKRHPQICALEVPTMPLSLENEGQHVQTLFPVDDALGGPGYFGFNPLAHMTECHTLANSESADALDREWAPHWGGAEDRAAEQGAEQGAEGGAAEGASRAPCRTSSPQILLEKSPSNLLRTRFLQARMSPFLMIPEHRFCVHHRSRRPTAFPHTPLFPSVPPSCPLRGPFVPPFVPPFVALFQGGGRRN